MVRRTLKHIEDSDDDADITDPGSSKRTSNMPPTDYPTPLSERESQNVSQSKPSSTSFEGVKKVSNDARKLVAAINEIDSLGTTDLALPKIVTIGDQSAGKSSVISALSGITVPRKDGLCTRCPLHLILRIDKVRKCTVSLELRYQLKSRKAWEALDAPRTVHFMDVSDPSQPSDAITRAQAAILNPSSDPKDFVSGNIDLQYQVEFSPNLVRLEISGPDCAELTFYDLPGVFRQSAKQEHQHLPGQIEKLVKEYMNNENHILLLACPMSNDTDNSAAGSLVNHNASAKKRCVGLLTKPDLFPEGNSTDTWRSLLEGKADGYNLEYGYFVTKQPSSQDLKDGISFEKARHDEEHFFQNTEPWASEFAAFHHLFGTEKLQAKLSEILVAQIRLKIPNIVEKVDSNLARCLEQLALLPVPPANPMLTVMRILSSLANQLKMVMQGELPHNEFILKWMALCEKFSQSVYLARPTMVSQSGEERKARKKAMARFGNANSSEPICVDDSDEDDKDEAMPGQKRSGSPLTPSPTKRARYTPLSQQSATSSSPNQYLLETIREVRLNKNTSAIGSVDHRADEHLIMETIKSWNDPLEQFVNRSKEALEEVIGKLIDEELRGWHGSPLHNELLDYSKQWILGAAKRVHEFGQRIILSEAIKPMTMNLKVKQEQDDEELNKLRDARRKFRVQLWFDELQAPTGKAILPAQRDKQAAEKGFDEKIGPDPWSKELEILGRVRGYYTVASASFVDTVCKMMRLDMFQHCQDNMIQRVEARYKLEEGSSESEAQEECKRLLREDERKANRRLFLERERDKYEKAKKSLEEVIG